MFSKACEYGIKAMIFVAQQSKEGMRVSLKDVARGTDSPVAFTGKILQQLTRQGLLHSLKGPTGGFILSAPADKIKLAAIVSAIDGDSIYRGCGLGLSECSETRPCPLHNKFKIVRDELAMMLESTSLEETTENIELGVGFLTR